METTPKQQPTLGEYRVGITFNPSNNPLVDTLKQKAAGFIDSAIAPFQRPKKVEPKAEAQAANDDDIQKAEMETVDVRPTAREKANEFRADCSLQNSKTENFEAKRCFIAADKFMGQAEAALAMDSYEDAQVLAEIAAMFAVKGVTKPEKPSHL